MSALLSPHPHGPQPSALGDFSFPTAEEGRAIPVIFGTVKISGGNTVWWGDLKSKAIKVGGGLIADGFIGGGLLFGKSQTTGFKYYLGCQFALCQGPVDALIDIQADVKSVPYTTSTVSNGGGSENYIAVNATGDYLFGGTKVGGGGGISGKINFYRGLQTQQPDAYLSSKQGRVVLDQSGIGYTYNGTGNGTMTALSGGSSAVDETITVTAVSIDNNNTHSTYQKMGFTAVGSVSGTLFNSAANAEGSTTPWADQAFSNARINFTITRGSTQFAPGDKFTVVVQQSHLSPSYRGLCYAVFQHLYVGTSNYLKPLSFILRRCPDGLSLGPSVANIGGDANPALMIYDLLTNVTYGLGIPPAKIDPASFTAGANTLASESLGLSMQFDTQASADQLIGEVLRHCDGLLYTDPATGLWTLSLARGGYDPATLPVFTVDNVIGTPDFSRGSWAETTNLISIKFISRTNNFNYRIVKAYDPGNIAITREVRPQTIDFKGISTEATAALVATRVLKTFAYPLSKIKIVANRAAWSLRPGGLFKFTWTPLGISNQIFRITRISYGELADGKITIDAVEDIFGIQASAFGAPPTSGWVNPTGIPLANSAEQLMELPAHILSAAGLPLTAVSTIYVAAMAARNPATFATGFQIWRDDGSGYFNTGAIGAFCPMGLLGATYRALTPANDPTGFTLLLSGAIDLDLLTSCSSAEFFQGNNLCLIDGEIMSWQTVTTNVDGTYTISGILRGIMDTVPADHAAGSRVWFFAEGGGPVGPSAFATDRTVNAKLLPTSSSGTLPIASATAESITTHSRASLPYPPGNFRMMGAAYGVRYATITGDLVLTFSFRNQDREPGFTPLKVQDDATDDPVTRSPLFAAVVTQPVSGGSGASGGLALGPGPTNLTPPGGQFVYRADKRNRDAVQGVLTVNIFGGRTDFIPVFAPDGSTVSYTPVFVPSLQSQQVAVTFTGFGFGFGQYFGGITS